jgi:O-acetylhomoserine (thiol)-lyase
MTDSNTGFETRALHGNGVHRDDRNGIRFPVYSGVAFDFASAEDMESAFTYRKPAHSYSRITNPTVEHLEGKLTLLEAAFGTIALSSGMAAITNTVLCLLRRGENLIASKFLFGNTYSLLNTTIAALGIETRFVDLNDPEAIRSAIDGQTRLILTETIANPQMVVPDFSALADIAADHNLILAVDGTVTTPFLFKAKEFGVHIVVHSTTKFISGGATSVGGAIVDLGVFDWGKCPALADYHKFGKSAFLARLRMEVYRNFGSCLAPQSAYLQILGLETLALRVRASCENCLQIARYLAGRKEIETVNYPGLEDSPGYAAARKYFAGYFGGVLSFEVADREMAFRFINRLRLIRRATNINDNKTLIIHPASTIYADYTAAQRTAMTISDKMIRLSVGIESIRDLIDDIDQALEP